MQCIRWERAPARGSLWLLPPGPDQVRNSASPEPIECTRDEEVKRKGCLPQRGCLWQGQKLHETSAFSGGERLVEEALCRHHALQGIVQDAVLACKMKADIAALRMLEEVGGRNACHADPACKLEREAGV